MNLKNILELLHAGEQIQLQGETPESVNIVTDPVFYITPNFNEIKTCGHPNFLLFSAAGATGKSTLAKYISYEYKAVYWNLARIYLGESTFHGTFVKALGFVKVFEFFNNLRDGKALLIIDAFDEADLISGRAAIELLLGDLVSIMQGTRECSIVLLARTETARFISNYLDDKAAAYAHYEIGFFTEYYSKEFIKGKIKQKQLPITPVVTQCIDQQFVLLRRVINDNSVIDSFIGYAPVLEALSAAFDEDRNTVKLLNSLNCGVESASVITAILENLLTREKEKVNEGLAERWSKKHPEFSNWEEVYTIEEQLFYLICYILFGEIDYTCYKNEHIPESMYADYTAAIDSFIAEHPFIQSFFDNADEEADFTGPAFRDYVLANILTREQYEYLAIEYLSNNQSLSHCPSQLLFDFYIHFSNNTISSCLFPYLYDSFIARETLGSNAGLSIMGNANQASAKFFLTQNAMDYAFVEYDLDVQIQNGCYKFRNISNANINVEHRVIIGEKKADARIGNSTVVCKQIIWNALNIVLEASNDEGTLLVSCEPLISQEGQYPKIIIRSDVGALRISAPNIESNHVLRKYAYDFLNDDTQDIIKFTHSIRKIIGCLRKHSKDTPARDKEFIDNVIIGNSKFTKSVFEFLLSTGVMYVDAKEPYLYKLDAAKSGQFGICWGQLSMGSNHSLSKAYEHFCKIAK